MDVIKLIVSLRPANDGSAAHREAIMLASDRLRDLEEQAAELDAQRGDLSVSGSAEQLREANSRAAEINDALSQVSFLIDGLRGGLNAIVEREQRELASIQAKEATARAKMKAFDAAFARYGELAAAIREIMLLAQEAKAARLALSNAVSAATSRGNMAAAGTVVGGLHPALSLGGGTDKTFFDMVVLPGFVAGDHSEQLAFSPIPIWMSEKTRLRFYLAWAR